MTKQEAIVILQIEKDLSLFDSATGEVKTLEELKFNDKKGYEYYEAMEIAIKALNFAIQIERWYKKDKEEKEEKEENRK